MSKPIICPTCSTENGLLAESCRGETCGRTLTRDGKIHHPQAEYSPFTWETKSVPKIIAEEESSQNADAVTERPPAATADEALRNFVEDLKRADSDAMSEKFAVLNAHDFLRYCLLLRSMSNQFEKDDMRIWFDDCLFFLRGGYNFALFFNLTSRRFVSRGRIFGGLAHGQQPKEKLAAWLKRLITEANARGRDEIHVFIADEVNEGHSIKGFLNRIYDEIDKLAEDRSRIACIYFHFFLVCNDQAKFNPVDFYKRLEDPKGRRLSYDKNYLLVGNCFRVFQGPLLTYDCSKYSGLSYRIKDDRYIAIRLETRHVAIQCPNTSENIWSYGTHDKSLADTLIKETLDWIKPTAAISIIDPKIEKCAICTDLFRKLANNEDCSEHIFSFRLPVDASKFPTPQQNQAQHRNDPPAE